MNNPAVEQLLDDCDAELQRLNTLIGILGGTSNVAPYLNKYAIIRACGSVEVAYKSLVADFCERRSKQQVKSYLKRHVRESSSNPSYENICKLLKEFDKKWWEEFKNRLKSNPNKSRIKTSIESLVGARNDFAHGGNPSSTLPDVIAYFADYRIILSDIDDIVQ